MRIFYIWKYKNEHIPISSCKQSLFSVHRRTNIINVFFKTETWGTKKIYKNACMQFSSEYLFYDETWQYAAYVHK